MKEVRDAFADAINAMREMLDMIPDGRSKWHAFEGFDTAMEFFDSYEWNVDESVQ